MKRVIYSILITVISLLFTSCEKTIEFKGTMLEPLLVVNNIYTQDQAFTVNISKSISALDKDKTPKAISNAIVTLFKDNQKLEQIPFTSKIDSIMECPYSGDCKWKKTYNGYYQSQYKAEPGNNYKLTVNVNGYEEVVAESFLPSEISVSKIDTISELNKEEYYSSIKQYANVSFQDVAGEENFYEFEIYRLNFQADSIDGQLMFYPSHIDRVWGQTDDPIINPDNSDDIIFGSYSSNMLFTDELFSGKSHTFKLQVNDVYNYYDDYGYGYGGYEGDYEKNYPYIRSYDVFIIELRNCSKDYFLYKKTFDAQRYSDDGLAEPVMVFNNIDNGVGIFGGYTNQRTPVAFSDLPTEIEQMIAPENLNDVIKFLYEQQQLYYY